MTAFDAGALLFKIQAVGAQLFKQDMASVKGSIDGVEQASTKAKGSADGLGTATDDVGKKSRRASEEQKKQKITTEQQTHAARHLSTALLAVGVAAAALVTLSVVKYAQFDQAMSNVGAAVMATAEEQKELGAAALQAGADTAYSATEAAAAEEELAKAGMSVTDIVGGSLNGALALAAAGQLQVARSAEIMATTLKQYKLPAEQAAHVSDVLAAGAGKAQGSVDDMALALSYVGPVAAGLKISLEETGGALAYMASQGILGERAGTGLRGVLMSLTSPSSIASKTMAEYGIEIFDSSGKMKSLAGVSEILKQRLGGLTEAERSAALGRIFGNEQITAARVLYDGGADAITEWTNKVNDSGYAAEQAAIRQNNLAGDIEKLGGSFETALIQTGSGANEVLRDLVQGTTELVNWVGELDPDVLRLVLTFGGAVAVVALLTGGTIKAVIGFNELSTAVKVMGLSMKTTSLIAGGAAIALTGILTVVALVAQAQMEARAKAKAYADTLEKGTQQVTDATRDMIAENLTAEKSFLWISQGSAADAAEKLGLSLDTVADAVEGDADALREVNKVIQSGIDEGMKPLVDANMEAYDAAVMLKGGLESEIGSLEEASKIAEQQSEITAEGTEVTLSAADAYLEAADNADELNSTLSELLDTINKANGVGQDAITANLDYKDALADVDEVIRKAREGVDANEDGVADFALTLDEATQAGRDNKGMLVDLAKDAWDAAAAQHALDGNTDAYRQRLEETRGALLDRVHDLGLQGDAAEALVDQILHIPSESEWKMIADATAAAQVVEGFITTYTGRSIPIYLQAMTDSSGNRPINVGQFADGGVVEYYANGGSRENHIAQIARGGAVRVWAEPETEGETYIPHALSKRARSTAILAETASRFGYQLVPTGAAAYADGGTTPGTVAAVGSPNVRVVLQPKGGIDLLKYIDVRVESSEASINDALRGG